jgi:hypothetical protein
LNCEYWFGSYWLIGVKLKPPLPLPADGDSVLVTTVFVGPAAGCDPVSVPVLRGPHYGHSAVRRLKEGAAAQAFCAPRLNHAQADRDNFSDPAGAPFSALEPSPPC